MAFYSEDDDEQNQVGGASQAVNKPGSGIVSGGTGAPGAAPAETAKVSTPGNSASPFVGINEYLNANKQQSGKLGGMVGDFVGQKVDTANQKLGEAEQNFGKQVQAGTTNVTDNNLVKAIERDSNQVLKDQTTLNQVRNVQKGYQGPSDFQSNQAYAGAKGDIDKAQTAVSNLGTNAGQKQLLTEQQLAGRGGRINRGAATLDQALLQASPEARAALNPAQQKGAALTGNINTAIQNAMNKVSGAQKTSQESSQALKNAFDAQYAQQQQELGQRVAQTNAGLAAQNQAIKGRVLGGDVSDQDLQMLGINRGEYDALRGDLQTYNTEDGGYGRKTDPLGNYVNFSGSNANIQNVASQEDYAKAAALRELAGYGGEYLSNPTLAGSYNKDLVDFDIAGAKNYLSPLKAAAAAKEQAAAEERARILAQSGVGGLSGAPNTIGANIGNVLTAPVKTVDRILKKSPF